MGSLAKLQESKLFQRTDTNEYDIQHLLLRLNRLRKIPLAEGDGKIKRVCVLRRVVGETVIVELSPAQTF